MSASFLFPTRVRRGNNLLQGVVFLFPSPSFFPFSTGGAAAGGSFAPEKRFLCDLPVKVGCTPGWPKLRDFQPSSVLARANPFEKDSDLAWPTIWANSVMFLCYGPGGRPRALDGLGASAAALPRAAPGVL